MLEQTIKLGCWPGELRPGDLTQDALKGTGPKPRQDRSRFLDSWTWDYSASVINRLADFSPRRTCVFIEGTAL